MQLVRNAPPSHKTATARLSEGKAQTLAHVQIPVKPPVQHRLEQLLALEAVAMAASERRALRHIMVNNSRQIVPYGHAIFLTHNHYRNIRSGAWIVRTHSSQGIVDRTSPYIRWIEKSVHQKISESTGEGVRVFRLEQSELSDDIAYPFTAALWLPITDDAGILYTREQDWGEGDIRLLKRLCACYTCAWKALSRAQKSSPKSPRRRRVMQLATALLLIAAIWPVSMTTLAPAEIVAARPQIVTAPINGTIERMHVTSNTYVRKGDVIASYVDTVLRNEHVLTLEETQVARARLKMTRLMSFSNPDMKRELKIMEAELLLAQGKYHYAGEKLQQATLIAESDGLLIYTGADEWRGRPVSVGERIATIADPSRVELKIEAPVGDGALLKPEAKVRLFLDADPLHALDARLRHAGFYPETTAGGSLAYEAVADLDTDNIPRIGARGVAKIYGTRAPLAYWLLRRPIVSVRQFVGV